MTSTSFKDTFDLQITEQEDAICFPWDDDTFSLKLDTFPHLQITKQPSVSFSIKEVTPSVTLPGVDEEIQEEPWLLLYSLNSSSTTLSSYPELFPANEAWRKTSVQKRLSETCPYNHSIHDLQATDKQMEDVPFCWLDSDNNNDVYKHDLGIPYSDHPLAHPSSLNSHSLSGLNLFKQSQDETWESVPEHSSNKNELPTTAYCPSSDYENKPLPPTPYMLPRSLMTHHDAERNQGRFTLFSREPSFISHLSFTEPESYSGYFDPTKASPKHKSKRRIRLVKKQFKSNCFSRFIVCLGNCLFPFKRKG
ncbi:hypothetical protein BD560DRAFT_451218 [Blakeslea trispora]|nr:hypothetical protein BD560DRAFT_451218 [Blakeslea trispora]